MTIILVLSLAVLPGSAFGNESEQTETDVDDRATEERPEPVDSYRSSDTFEQTDDAEDDTPTTLGRADTTYPHWMWIIGRNAVWGGMLGGLIGVGAYLVTGLDLSPWIIPQFAGGGILLGAASGVVEAAFWSDSYAGERSNALRWSEREMPTTYDILLLRVDF